MQDESTVGGEYAGPQGVRRPNLFIVGAPRCGTTSLHYTLDDHPAIFMTDLKEPGYFVPEVDAYPKDPQWYLGLFESAGDAEVVGESSTHYAKLPTYDGVPERIAQFCHAPRFIYLMRDPIDRIVSQYWKAVRQNAEHRPMRLAIRRDVEYVAFSDYRMQLEPYFETFGRDRVLTVTFEELVGEPAEVLRRIFGWLGVDPDEGPDTLAKRNATGAEVTVVRGLGLLRRFRHSELWASLAPYVPSALKTVGKRLSERRAPPEEVEEQKVAEILRPRLRPKVEELESYLERSFDEWTTTLGCSRASGE